MTSERKSADRGGGGGGKAAVGVLTASALILGLVSPALGYCRGWGSNPSFDGPPVVEQVMKSGIRHAKNLKSAKTKV